MDGMLTRVMVDCGGTMDVVFSYFAGVDVVFFFFKQKTAYEMRISDWSSDVCSSDLIRGVRVTDHQYPIVDNVGLVDPTAVQTYIDLLLQYVDWGDRVISLRGIGEKHTPKEGLFREPVWITPAWQAPAHRSEERRVGKACVGSCRYRGSPYN